MGTFQKKGLDENYFRKLFSFVVHFIIEKPLQTLFLHTGDMLYSSLCFSMTSLNAPIIENQII